MGIVEDIKNWTDAEIVAHALGLAISTADEAVSEALDGEPEDMSVWLFVKSVDAAAKNGDFSKVREMLNDPTRE